jgi:hypothetical protein
MYSLGGEPFMHNYGPSGSEDQNTFLGISAGNLTNSSAFNTAIGYQALSSLTVGSGNTAVGNQCLKYFSDPIFGENTFVGNSAGVNIVSGGSEGYNNGSNIGIGFIALKGAYPAAPTKCIAIGERAMFSAVNPDSNIAIGNGSQETLTTGSNNISLGVSTLVSLVNGNNNVIIGNDSGGAYTTSESNNIDILNLGITGESNAIHIGTQGTQTTCSLAGITGVTTANSQLVTVNSSTGQLGAKAIQGVMTWTTVGASGTLAVNNGYLCTSGGALSFSLPATAAVGTQIGLVLAGATSWAISQAVLQSITISPTTSTPGPGGSVTSLTAGTTLTLICDVANTHWTAIATTGTFTIV